MSIDSVKTRKSNRRNWYEKRARIRRRKKVIIYIGLVYTKLQQESPSDNIFMWWLELELVLLFVYPIDVYSNLVTTKIKKVYL